jgi:hypothetical protein
MPGAFLIEPNSSYRRRLRLNPAMLSSASKPGAGTAPEKISTETASRTL